LEYQSQIFSMAY